MLALLQKKHWGKKMTDKLEMPLEQFAEAVAKENARLNNRIEKLEAALRIVINWESTLDSKDGLDWGEVMDIASQALEGKDE
jgi:hypothetical protein